MKFLIFTLTFVFLVVFSVGNAVADNRERLNVKPEIQEQLITNMRVQFAHIDDILFALGEGDFGAAADIAAMRMTIGHSRWEQMLEDGATLTDIQAERDKFMKLSSEERAALETTAGHGGGLGRHMPADFRSMGQAYHEAAGNLAEVLRAAGTPPRAEDYKAAIEALEEVTAACMSCHETYRIPKQGE